LASVEVSPSQKSQKYDFICHSDQLEEKSISWLIGACFILVVICAESDLGFIIRFFDIEYVFHFSVTTVSFGV
jgi:hypothetical protein